MSLIFCPECGSKISEKAITCPQCGYISGDCNLPISMQAVYECIPSFQYDIVEWKPDRDNLLVVSNEDNKKMIEYFGNFNVLQKSFPTLANTIQSMANQETILVANMDNYVKKMIEKGVYRLSVDKNGEILPTIRDATGIVKQVRLNKVQITPELTTSLNRKR